MKASSAFPSPFLKADDLQGKDVTVTIDGVAMEEIGQGAQKSVKPVLSFVGKEKGLVCNKTNWNTIIKLHGDETDNWQGKRIILSPREVEYQGEMVLSIRVSLKAPSAAPTSTRQKADAIPGDPEEEEVPF
jgi:hypothetical protein